MGVLAPKFEFGGDSFHIVGKWKKSWVLWGVGVNLLSSLSSNEMRGESHRIIVAYCAMKAHKGLTLIHTAHLRLSLRLIVIK